MQTVKGTVVSLPPSPKQNQILAALPAAEYARLLPCLEMAELKLGDVLYEPGVPMTHAYFPVSGIISLLYVMDGGASAEIAITGNEGLVGVSLFSGRRKYYQSGCGTERGHQLSAGGQCVAP